MGSEVTPRDFARRVFEASAQKHPLTPAMRRAIRRDRKRWIALYIGVGIVITAALGVGVASSPQKPSADEWLFLSAGMAVCYLALIGAMIWKVRRLDRDARDGIFLRIAGKVAPVKPGATPSYQADATTNYIEVDGMTIPVSDSAAVAIQFRKLKHATIDMTQYDHEVIEIRDEDEKVIYRLRGYDPESPDS